MSQQEKNVVIAVGNVYIDTNIFGIDTNGKDTLELGKEYVADNSESVLGGSSVNFLLQAKKLDVPVAFIGKVGNDEHGDKVKTLLREQGVAIDLIATSESETTSIASNMILAHHGGFIGLHWGTASRSLGPEDIDFDNPIFTKAAAIYFGGTVKQEKIFNNFSVLFESLRKKQIKIIIDPNRFPLQTQDTQRDLLLNALPLVDCYLPNEEEITNLTKKQDLDHALDVVSKAGAKMVVVKLGEKGCRIRTESEDCIVPGYTVVPRTTVGAGDAFNAGFITQYLQGKPLKECGKFANATAAIKVSKNITPDIQEVMKFIQVSR